MPRGTNIPATDILYGQMPLTQKQQVEEAELKRKQQYACAKIEEFELQADPSRTDFTLECEQRHQDYSYAYDIDCQQIDKDGVCSNYTEVSFSDESEAQAYITDHEIRPGGGLLASIDYGDDADISASIQRRAVYDDKQAMRPTLLHVYSWVKDTDDVSQQTISVYESDISDQQLQGYSLIDNSNLLHVQATDPVIAEVVFERERARENS